MIIHMQLRVFLIALLLTLPFGSARADNYASTIKVFQNAGESGSFFGNSYGYAVFPTIGKGGVGIGGVAFAMASKDTVANLFGSLVIFLDKPFQIGDWIEMGSTEGTVEEVGLRTTRIRTFANSLVTVPNLLFTSNTINKVGTLLG